MIRKLLRLFRKRIKVGLYVTEKMTTCTNCDGIQSVIGISKYGDPYDEGNRAEEIQDFINKNLVEGDNYIIFDDEDFAGTLLAFGKHFIQTNWDKGLTKRNIKKASPQ